MGEMGMNTKRAMQQRLQDVTGLPVADERAWL